MSGLFSHGGATSLYLSLYLVTWVAHLILVGAVAGGAALCAIDAIRGSGSRTAAVLRGDLPLLLGLGITAGVAPLLFLQILYREAFYTASLLMHLRFLAILPALLGCFYLLYLGKTERGRRFARPIYAVAALAALFVGYSFAELHSLALEPAMWTEQYRAARLAFVDVGVAVRHLAFLGVAAAATGLVGLWAGRWRGEELGAALAPIAIAGLVLAVIAGAAAGRLAGAITDPPVIAVIAAAAAAMVAAIGWGAIAARRQSRGWPLVGVTAGTALFLLALAVAREALRADRLDLAALSERHAATAEGTGGLWLFALFVVINGAAVAWCITRAWRARRQTPPAREAR